MSDSTRGLARPRVSTIAKVRDLLVLFTPERHTWGLSELSEALEWDLATTHRLANALVEIDMLSRADGESSYQLGVFAVELGAVYRSTQPHRTEIVEAMEALADESGLTAQIGVLAGESVSIVDSCESASPLRAAALLGERLPLHATAVGKAIIAQLPDQAVTELLPEHLESFTEQTITDRAVLLEELAAIRAGELARVNNELSEGLCALAIALPPGSYSTDIASLTCAGPPPSIAPESWSQAESMLTELRARYAESGSVDGAGRR